MKRIAFAAVLFALAACAKGDDMSMDSGMAMGSSTGASAMGMSTMADTTKAP